MNNASYEREVELFKAISANLTPEETLLAGLQGIIAARITIKRRELGLSQKQLAEEMGVSQALVSRWEKGETNYTLETLIRIASRLGIEMQCPFVVPPPRRYGDSGNVTYLDTARAWSAAGCVISAEGYMEPDAQKM